MNYMCTSYIYLCIYTELCEFVFVCVYINNIFCTFAKNILCRNDFQVHILKYI